MDNPTSAHMKRALKRPRKPGNIAAVQRKLWWAILTAEALMTVDDATAEQRLRAIHALTQAVATYANLVKTTDLEARIAALEQAIHQRRSGHGA